MNSELVKNAVHELECVNMTILIDGHEWIRPVGLLTPHVPEETLGMAHLGEGQRAVTILVNYVNNETEKQWEALGESNKQLKAYSKRESVW